MKFKTRKRKKNVVMGTNGIKWGARSTCELYDSRWTWKCQSWVLGSSLNAARAWLGRPTGDSLPTYHSPGRACWARSLELRRLGHTVEGRPFRVQQSASTAAPAESWTCAQPAHPPADAEPHSAPVCPPSMYTHESPAEDFHLHST